MLISDSKKFVFIHIPKTGGTSILGALAPFGNKWKPGTKIKDVRGWQHRHHTKGMHGGWGTDPRLLSDLKRKGYYQFAFVRNPWDKVVSIWYKIGKKLTLYQFLRFLMYNEKKGFVEKTDPVHYKAVPQSKWVMHRGRMMVDRVGRFESLLEDYEAICKDIGLDPLPNLPHFNPGQRGHYRRYYDDTTIEIVADLYRGDIERFGYSF